MWIKSQNDNGNKPNAIDKSGNHVIVRRHFNYVANADDFPAHWEYDEWQMTAEQYEVYQDFAAQIREQSDALVELAELIGG